MGLCGEFRKIALRARLLLHKPLYVVEVRAELVRLAQRTEDDAGAASLDVRAVGREVRREQQHGVAGVEESLAKELLEDLGSGRHDDVFRPDFNAEFTTVIIRDSLPE